MLYTYNVSSGAKSYVTQHQAEHWEGAKQVLIASEAFRQFAAASMPCTRATAVTTEYQRDSSSKRPRSSVVSAAHAPTRRRMSDIPAAQSPYTKAVTRVC
jgi:hypothetical protein